MVVCDLCGQRPDGATSSDKDAADDTVPYTWVTSVENGKTSRYCDTCAREHVRAMESKLDSAWW